MVAGSNDISVPRCAHECVTRTAFFLDRWPTTDVLLPNQQYGPLLRSSAGPATATPTSRVAAPSASESPAGAIRPRTRRSQTPLWFGLLEQQRLLQGAATRAAARRQALALSDWTAPALSAARSGIETGRMALNEVRWVQYRSIFIVIPLDAILATG